MRLPNESHSDEITSAGIAVVESHEVANKKFA
jgi:hypothetical protein